MLTSAMPAYQMRESRFAHFWHTRAEVAEPGPPATRIKTDCIGPKFAPQRKQFQEEMIFLAFR